MASTRTHDTDVSALRVLVKEARSARARGDRTDRLESN